MNVYIMIYEPSANFWLSPGWQVNSQQDLILNLTLTLCSYLSSLNSNSYSISPQSPAELSGGPRTTQIIVPLVVSTPSWRKLPPTITSIVTQSPQGPCGRKGTKNKTGGTATLINQPVKVFILISFPWLPICGNHSSYGRHALWGLPPPICSQRAQSTWNASLTTA